MATIGNSVARQRAVAGLRQQDLASRVGVSRQSLSVLESGRSVPSAALALRLARELGCKVEELFWIDDQRATLSAELADAGPPGRAHPEPGARAARVVLASVDGRWVAHPLADDDAGSFLTAADGVIAGRARAAAGARGASRSMARVTLLDDGRSRRDTLLCAGCAPAFGILAARASAGRPHDRVLWLERSSGEALDLLGRGQIHVAGAHLYDEQTREFNVPFVQRRLPGRSMLIFNLARWEAGLVVAPGNPRRIRGVRDLVRPEVSFVRRQAGAAAQDLIDRMMKREGLRIPVGRTRASVTARGHMEVARLVALGVADTGVALPAVARAHGLDFVPLAEERFDLIVSKDLAADVRVVRLLETLSGRSFRREIDTLGGHTSRDAGRLIADTSLLH